MNRKEFLEKLGPGTAFTLTTSYFGSCSLNNDFKPTGSVDFTIDLDDPANSSLTTDGGYIIKDRVVITRDNMG